MHQQAVPDEHQASEVTLGQLGHRHSDKTWPAITLEGEPTDLDVHEGSANNVQTYRRHTVSGFCTHHRSALKGLCNTTRNAGPAQTAIFGYKEPLAFLGAWLAAGEQFVTLEDQLRYMPQKDGAIACAVHQ